MFALVTPPVKRTAPLGNVIAVSVSMSPELHRQIVESGGTRGNFSATVCELVGRGLARHSLTRLD